MQLCMVQLEIAGKGVAIGVGQAGRCNAQGDHSSARVGGSGDMGLAGQCWAGGREPAQWVRV